MVNNDLETNIYEYLLQFNSVSIKQIKRMFRRDSPAAIEWHVNTLLFERYIGQTEEIDEETQTESIDSATFFVRKTPQNALYGVYRENRIPCKNDINATKRIMWRLWQ